MLCDNARDGKDLAARKREVPVVAGRCAYPPVNIVLAPPSPVPDPSPSHHTRMHSPTLPLPCERQKPTPSLPYSLFLSSHFSAFYSVTRDFACLPACPPLVYLISLAICPCNISGFSLAPAGSIWIISLFGAERSGGERIAGWRGYV